MASDTVLSFETYPHTSTCSTCAGVAQAPHEEAKDGQEMNDTCNPARKVVEELERCVEEEGDGNHGCRKATSVLKMPERRARIPAY